MRVLRHNYFGYLSTQYLSYDNISLDRAAIISHEANREWK